MADPATLAAVASIASAGFGVISSISQAKSQQKIAERNAQIAEQQALQIEQEAAFEESLKRSQTQKLKARQRAAQGASGGPVGEFSNLLVLEESAVLGEIDALTIRYRGDVAAGRARAQAATDRFGGKVARQTGLLKAGTSLLTGVTAVSGIVAKNPGSFGFEE